MTEDIEPIARRLGVGRKRGGRSIYDLQARSDLVWASQRPGAPQAGSARQCGINANALSNWVRQHERSKGGVSVLDHAVVDMPATSSTPCAFVALEVNAVSPSSASALS